MNAAEIFAATTSKGWLATLFGRSVVTPVRRISSGFHAGQELSPHLTGAVLALALVEERARAATSGFEMGEYEPLSRRN